MVVLYHRIHQILILIIPNSINLSSKKGSKLIKDFKKRTSLYTQIFKVINLEFKRLKTVISQVINLELQNLRTQNFQVINLEHNKPIDY